MLIILTRIGTSKDEFQSKRIPYKEYAPYSVDFPIKVLGSSEPE